MDEMCKTYIKKCEEVFEKKNIINISGNDLEKIKEYTGEISELYKYILGNYSNVFLKDKHEIFGKYQSYISDENGAEPFLYFLGTGKVDNIFEVYDMYKKQLPNQYFPIALADGGNLLCVNKIKTGIFIWLHDECGDDLFKIFDSLEELIMSIEEIEDIDESVEFLSGEIEMSEEFLEALSKFMI